MDSVLFFASRPDFETLCCIDVIADESQFYTQPSQRDQPSQFHVTKCREIIFTEQDVLTSPAYEQNGMFYIILTRDLFKTGRVQKRIGNQGFFISKPYKVGPTLYQTCLRYTVVAKLAPAWNKLGDWYVNGKEFLTHSGYAQAVKMNLSVNKNEIYVSLGATLVRSPPLEIEDLDLSEKEKLSLLNLADSSDPTGCVEFMGFQCHVLPSMKKGWIKSLSLNIPDDSPFETYKDLCRYWKNLYGYRLPRTDEEILYCQISFWSSSNGKKFTYPNVCLRVNPLQVMGRVDPKPILKSFLQDIHSRINTVCGMPLRFTPKIQYPVISLVNSMEAGDKSCLSNKSVKKSTVPYRSAQSVAISCTPKPKESKSCISDIGVVQNYSTTSFQNTQGSSKSISENSINNFENSQTSKDKEIITKTDKTSFPLITDNFVSKKYPEAEISTVSYKQIGARSDTRTPQNNVSKNTTTGIPASSATKFVPLFRPKQKQQQMSSKYSLPSMDFKSSKTNKIVPVFQPHIKPPVKSHLSTSAVTQKKSATCTTPKQTKVIDIKPDIMKKTQSQKIDNKMINPLSKSPLTFGTPKNMNTLDVRKGAIKKTKPVKTPEQTIIPSMKSPLTLGTPSTSIAAFSDDDDFETFLTPLTPILSRPNDALQVPAFKSTVKQQSLQEAGKKRKSLQNEDGVKKAKTVPKLVEAENVEKMARNNQLSKVNAASLIAWLRSKGVACRAKDKKSDLIEKAQQHLSTTTTTCTQEE